MKRDFLEVKRGYNKLAKEYHRLRVSGKKFHNEYLEMPTTLKLLGNVRGKKILDLGCGTGVYAKILTKKGARLKGIDISEKEIEIARKESPDVEFIIGNAEKLPYKSKEFDIVLSCLVLEHFKDWNNVLKEVNRVLKKNGLFVFSIGNPVSNCIRKKGRNWQVVRNYFKEQEVISYWWGDIYSKWYHKPLGTIIRLLVNNGFELIDYEDAFPLRKAKKLFPREYNLTSKIPYFCTWKWGKNANSR